MRRWKVLGLGGLSVPSPTMLSVQRFLFYPDGGVDGETPPVLATQHVLAELGRVHAAATRGGHAEALLEEALQNLRREGAESTGVNVLSLQDFSFASSWLTWFRGGDSEGRLAQLWDLVKV